MAGYRGTKDPRAHVVLTTDLPHTEVAGPPGDIKRNSQAIPCPGAADIEDKENSLIRNCGGHNRRAGLQILLSCL